MVWIFLLLMVSLCGAKEASPVPEFAELDLPELLKVKVTSPSKKAEQLFRAPVAAHVLTREDIARSGALNVPEALRLVPGVQVARIDSARYAITTRGFNDEFASKLLVLIDGRAVYTTLFSGVFWEAQDVLLEDIDRIEVILGPGGTLWGANAVNGVINILTRGSKETQGWMLVGAAGTEELGNGAVRYGGTLKKDAYYRLYAKYFHRDALAGGDHADGTRLGQAGFRMDWETEARSQFTVQGGVHGVRAGQTAVLPMPTGPAFAGEVSDDIRYSGGNILGRWTRRLKRKDELRVQAYFDHSRRASGVTDSQYTADTIDADAQRRFHPGADHELTVGAGLRVVRDQTSGSTYEAITPAEKATILVSVFGRDEITLVPRRLALTLGLKLERNDYTGVEVQPNARLAFTPTARETVWGSFSRAVRTPSRVERGASVPVQTGPAVVRVLGNERFGSEEMHGYEAGYRKRLTEDMAIDVAAFLNFYGELRSQEPVGIDASRVPPEVLQRFDNGGEGTAYGFEVAGTVKAFDWWALRPAYSLLRMELEPESLSLDSTTPRRFEGASPQHQAILRSEMSLIPGSLDVAAVFRYVDRLPSLGVAGFATVDARAGWRFSDNLEAAVVGTNLLQSEHLEFVTFRSPSPAPRVERSVYGKVIWRL